MACLDDNAVAAFFERRLSSEVAANVEVHVGRCGGCRSLLAAFAAAYPSAQPPVATVAHHQDPQPPAFEVENALLGRALAAAQAEARVGRVLAGRWHLDRVLGVGGMAQVFAATHRNGKRAAVKMLRPELAASADMVRRFVREGRAANAVGHPRAMAVLDDGFAEDGSMFLVMELLEGETLRGRLRRVGPLPVPEVLRIASEVLEVLQAAHERGIVHRDIKPENVFVTSQGIVRVLDFGIARLREPARSPGSDDGVATTQAGALMGTPAFMPPEQARGYTLQIDGRTDVWAVGATMYTLLSGRHPRERSDRKALNEDWLAAMTEPVESLDRALPGLPREVVAVVDRALAFAQVDRWDSARSMQAAIAAIRLDRPARANSFLGPRSWLAAGALLVAVAALAIARPTSPTSYDTAKDEAPATSPPVAVDSVEPVGVEVPPLAAPPAPALATTPAPAGVIAQVRKAPPLNVAPVASPLAVSPSTPPTLPFGEPAAPPRDLLDRRH